MNYREARKATVSRAQAVREVKRHGGSVEEFLAECGERESYRGAVVLDWLGY